MNRNPNQNHSEESVFWLLSHSLSNEEIAPYPKQVERIKIAKLTSNGNKLTVDLATFFGPMILDFVSRMLLLKYFPKDNFRFENKTESILKHQKIPCAQPLLQHHGLRKKQ